MPFKKGRAKTGGRVKGSLNRDTREIKEFLKSLINETQIEKDLESLSPLERLNIITKILPYVTPKAIQVEISSPPITFILPQTCEDLESDEIR